MHKSEKAAFILVVFLTILWAIMVIWDVPAGHSIYREILIVLVYVSYIIYLLLFTIKKWQNVIDNSNSIETVLVKYNFFPIATSEEERIIYCNDKFLRLLGYPRMILFLGKKLNEIFEEETYSEIESFLKGDERRSARFIKGKLINRFKSKIDVNFVIQKVYYNGKRYEHIDFIDTDFLKLASEYLPANIVNVVNSIEDAIIYMNTNQEVIWINKAGEELLNLRQGDSIRGKKCFEVFLKEKKRCENCPVIKTIETGRPMEVDISYPDGKYYHIISEPVKDDAGSLIGVIKIVKDITKQREEEIKRLATEARLSLIADQLPTLIWTVDQELKVTYVSGTVLKNIKVYAENLLGRTLYELFNTDNPEYPVIKHTLMSLTGESGSYQIKIMGRYYIVYYKPLINYEGKISGCVGVSHDITDLIEVQKELEEKNQILMLIDAIYRVLSRSKSETQLIDNILPLFLRHSGIVNAILFIKDPVKDTIKLSKSILNDDLKNYYSQSNLLSSLPREDPLILSFLGKEIKNIEDVERADLPNALKAILLNLGYRSLLFIPVVIEDRIHSIICLISNRRRCFLSTEYYKNIADNIGYAIINLRLNKRA